MKNEWLLGEEDLHIQKDFGYNQMWLLAWGARDFGRSLNDIGFTSWDFDISDELEQSVEFSCGRELYEDYL